MASNSDDDFVNKVLDRQLGRLTNTNSKEPMSQNRKDTIRGKPVITQKEADDVTKWQNWKKEIAEWKLKSGKQGHAFDELKPEGNVLKINEDLVKQRNLNNDKLIKQMIHEDK